MKIAVFIKSTTLHKGHGGLETQNKAVCEELVKRGHLVTIFSPKRELEYSEKEENGVKYVFIDANYYRYLFSSFGSNSWYKKSLEVFTKYHESEKFDLVLSQSSSAESIIENKNSLNVKVISISHGTAASEFNTFVKNMSGLKDIVWLVRNTQYFLRQYFGRQRRFINHSNKVIAVSNYVKKALIEETFVPEEKVVVIHNGVDSKDYSDLQEAKEVSKAGSSLDTYGEDRIKLYFLGRIEKSKGIFTILDIVKNLELGFVLHIVGDGPDLNEAKDKSKALGLSNNVIFHGKSLHREFIKLYRPDIFVFPTKRIEGFPMVLVESMFASLPVVAFDMGGVSDAVEDERTGYLIRNGSTKEFKEKLIKIMSDCSLRLTFGKNAKEKAEKEFRLDKMIDAYESLFKEVLK
ncbi:MAG: glycosyltransferase family 4 protein [Patescibacteria group bacterium]